MENTYLFVKVICQKTLSLCIKYIWRECQVYASLSDKVDTIQIEHYLK